MTQQQEDTIISTVLEIINENGFDGIGEAVSILINEAMKMKDLLYLMQSPGNGQSTGPAMPMALKTNRLHPNLEDFT